jgi:hypothetical protein
MESTPMSFQPTFGWCEREVQEELAGLQLVSAEAKVRPGEFMGPSPPSILQWLAGLSNRWSGAHAISLRRKPVPAAYRVFFRHIGLDPDVVRTPIEAVVLERMLNGGFLTGGLLLDAILIALVETGVPVWALDATAVDGPLGIRASHEHESLGRSPNAPRIPGGRLVVADASSALAMLFGQLAPGHEPRPDADRLALFALRVPGVPFLHVEEALWMCVSALENVA